MTLTFYAQPYQIGVEGFYFRSSEEWDAKKNTIKNHYGEPVEEFEIQFIDGKALECDFSKAWGVNQANIDRFFQVNDAWDDHAKLSFILAVGESGYTFDADTVGSSDFEVDIYFIDTMRDLAIEFVEEGLFGDVPDKFQNYIDYDAIARDLSIDYSTAEIAGQRLIYRID